MQRAKWLQSSNSVHFALWTLHFALLLKIPSEKQFKVQNAKWLQSDDSLHFALWTLHFALLLKIPSNPVKWFKFVGMQKLGRGEESQSRLIRSSDSNIVTEMDVLADIKSQSRLIRSSDSNLFAPRISSGWSVAIPSNPVKWFKYCLRLNGITMQLSQSRLIRSSDSNSFLGDKKMADERVAIPSNPVKWFKLLIIQNAVKDACVAIPSNPVKWFKSNENGIYVFSGSRNPV